MGEPGHEVEPVEDAHPLARQALDGEPGTGFIVTSLRAAYRCWLPPAVLPSQLDDFLAPDERQMPTSLRKTRRVAEFIEIVNDDINVTSVTGARIEPTGNAARPE